MNLLCNYLKHIQNLQVYIQPSNELISLILSLMFYFFDCKYNLEEISQVINPKTTTLEEDKKDDDEDEEEGTEESVVSFKLKFLSNYK